MADTTTTEPLSIHAYQNHIIAGLIQVLRQAKLDDQQRRIKEQNDPREKYLRPRDGYRLLTEARGNIKGTATITLGNQTLVIRDSIWHSADKSTAHFNPETNVSTPPTHNNLEITLQFSDATNPQAKGLDFPDEALVKAVVGVIDGLLEEISKQSGQHVSWKHRIADVMEDVGIKGKSAPRIFLGELYPNPNSKKSRIGSEWGSEHAAAEHVSYWGSTVSMSFPNAKTDELLTTLETMARERNIEIDEPAATASQAQTQSYNRC